MTLTKKISIAIDGPAAAGKSTVSKILAEKLGYIYVDTGAMYRALTYKAIQNKVALDDEKKLFDMLVNTTIDLELRNSSQCVLLDSRDVSEEIREHDVTNAVSIVAAHRLIREEMVIRQKAMGSNGGIVMDGRDIGTTVLADAELKIFLLASVEIRAKRRFEENSKKGFEVDLETLQAEIKHRDKLDTERAESPLKKACDAIELDTSALSIPEVVTEIYKLALERMGRN